MTTTLDKTRIDQYQAQAEEHLATAAESAGGARAAAAYPVTGKVTVSILGLGVGKIVAEIEYPNGDRRRYEAWIYGAIAGAGGISFGGGSFGVPASALTGKTSCALALGVTGVTVTWWNGTRSLGTFIGAGPNVGVGAAGGEGDWTKG